MTWSELDDHWAVVAHLPDQLLAQCLNCGRSWEMERAPVECGYTGYALLGFTPLSVECAQRIIGEFEELWVGFAAEKLMVTRLSAARILGEPDSFYDQQNDITYEAYGVEAVAAAVGTDAHLGAVLRRRSVDSHVIGAVEAVRSGKLSVADLCEIWLDILEGRVPPLLTLALSSL